MPIKWLVSRWMSAFNPNEFGLVHNMILDLVAFNRYYGKWKLLTYFHFGAIIFTNVWVTFPKLCNFITATIVAVDHRIVCE